MPAGVNTLFPTTVPERSRLPKLIGYGLAIVCLVWVLHDFHIVQAMRELAKVDWKWVLVGMGFDVLSYVVQAVRWKWLLSPFGKVKLTHAVRAVFAGLFANLIFPLRPGELLRSYLISDSEDITIGRVVGSVGVERLVDLVIATASLAVAVAAGGFAAALPAGGGHAGNRDAGAAGDRGDRDLRAGSEAGAETGLWKRARDGCREN